MARAFTDRLDLSGPLDDDQLLTPAEAAAFLAVSEPTVYRLVRSGRIRSVRPGSRGIRLRVGELRRYVAISTAPLPSIDDGLPKRSRARRRDAAAA